MTTGEKVREHAERVDGMSYTSLCVWLRCFGNSPTLRWALFERVHDLAGCDYTRLMWLTEDEARQAVADRLAFDLYGDLEKVSG